MGYPSETWSVPRKIPYTAAGNSPQRGVSYSSSPLTSTTKTCLFQNLWTLNKFVKEIFADVLNRQHLITWKTKKEKRKSLMNYLLQSWLSNFRVKISRWRRLERNCDISFTRFSHNKTKCLLAIWPTNFGKLYSSLVKRKSKEKHLASLKNHNVVVNTGT